MLDDIPAPIQGALMEIESGGVCTLKDVQRVGMGWLVETSFHVEFPQRDQKDGQTKMGVRTQEPVRFLFRADFPTAAPDVFLRPDFPADCPHMYSQTAGPEKFRMPCVYAGNLSDLLHSVGQLFPILVQVNDWLTRAAREGLYDEEHGWEPVILPDNNGTLVIEASALTNPIGANEGGQILPLQFEVKGDRYVFKRRHGHDDGIPCYASLRGLERRETALVQVWPLPKHTRTMRGCADVETLEQLFDRVNATETALKFPTMRRLKEVASQINTATNGELVTVPVVLVLTLRRPVRITSQSHALEPIPFLLDVPVRKPQELDPTKVRVRLLNHRQPASSELNARLSGIRYMPAQDPTILIGSGSLGSKIGAHLMKAGIDPLRFIDHSELKPHVMARHEINFPLAEQKADAMGMMAIGHGTAGVAHVEDAIKIIKGEAGKRWSDLGIRRARFLIDTTASDQVQEALIGAGDSLPGRLISGSFFARGDAAGLFLEGENRSPRLDDLRASLYDIALDSPFQPFVHRTSSLEREYVGIGCHTMTMIMSNAQASVFAAGLGKQVLNYHSVNPDQNGEWWFGYRDSSGLGSIWHQQRLGRTYLLDRKHPDQKNWEVRILAPAVVTMHDEAARYAPSEAGGTLYGIVNPLMRRIIVSRAENPPGDSKRELNQFVHGIAGLRERVREIEERSRGLVTLIGTWHSHPRGGGPSSIDRATANTFARLRERGPFLMVIVQPDNVCRALIEER